MGSCCSSSSNNNIKYSDNVSNDSDSNSHSNSENISITSIKSNPNVNENIYKDGITCVYKECDKCGRKYCSYNVVGNEYFEREHCKICCVTYIVESNNVNKINYHCYKCHWILPYNLKDKHDFSCFSYKTYKN
jgi:hypothetical protein